MAEQHNEKAEKIDMTPQPTQEQLDELAGGKDHKERKDSKGEKAKAPEPLPPTPTQAEADEAKAALFNTTVEEDKKRNKEYVEAHGGAKKSGKDAEDLTPTPTQAELDAAKKEIMFEPEDAPGGGTDPQKRKTRTMEAEKPSQGYQTRTLQPTHAPEHRTHNPE